MSALLLLSVVSPFTSNAKTYTKANYLIQGHYIEASGTKLWIEKYGKGTPAVILINGAGDSIQEWNTIIPALSRFTTVIGYDRPGLGNSPPIKDITFPRTAKAVAKQIETVLKALNISPPYVFVGHSIAGLYISYFARNYPEQVAGIVTVDGNTVTQVFWNKLDIKGLPTDAAKNVKAFNQEEDERQKLLVQQVNALKNKKNLTAADYLLIEHNLEVIDKPESARQIEASPAMPQVPLIALSEGSSTDTSYALWHASIQQFAEEVACGKFIIVPDTGHYIQIDQPDYVIAAIKTVVSASRSHISLCKLSLEPPLNKLAM